MEPGGTMLISITRRADVGGFDIIPESTTDLEQWVDPPGLIFVGNVRLPGTPALDRLSFRIPSPVGATRQFVRFAIR
jgi:hypothetical protein